MHISALVNNPYIPLFSQYPVLQVMQFCVAAEEIHAVQKQMPVIGMYHAHKFILEPFLYLSPCISEHLQEFITDVQKIVLRRIRAPMIPPWHIVIQKHQFPVLTKKHGISFCQLLLYHHSL